MPFVQAISMAAAPTQVASIPCPPPTSIEEIQQVGDRCGIALEDLSVEKLLDGQQMVSTTED